MRTSSDQDTDTLQTCSVLLHVHTCTGQSVANANANMFTQTCSGDSGAAGETAVVPEEPAQHDETAGGRVPELLLRENSADTRRQETAQNVITHTHTHRSSALFHIDV